MNDSAVEAAEQMEGTYTAFGALTGQLLLFGIAAGLGALVSTGSPNACSGA